MEKLISIKTLQKILPRLYALLPFYLMTRRALPPLHVYFEVTYRCNLRCDMCHFLEIIEDTETQRKYKNELSAAEIKAAIARLPRYAVITFTGGEVFMKSDFMEILDFAASRNKVHIITNGTSLSGAVVEQLMARRLRSLFGAGLFFIGVSLEGKEEFHDRCVAAPGSFRKTINGLERLTARRRELGGRYPLLHLTTVIGRQNVADLPWLYEYANGLGVDVCNLVLHNPATYWHGKDYDQKRRLGTPTPPVETIDPDLLGGVLDTLARQSAAGRTQLRFSPNGVTREEIIRYYNNAASYKDYRCFAPWAKAGVSAYGDVFSCPHYRAGNIQEHGFAIPWNAKSYGDFREMVKRSTIFPGCLGCCQSEYAGPESGGKPAS